MRIRKLIKRLEQLEDLRGGDTAVSEDKRGIVCDYLVEFVTRGNTEFTGPRSIEDYLARGRLRDAVKHMDDVVAFRIVETEQV